MHIRRRFLLLATAALSATLSPATIAAAQPAPAPDTAAADLLTCNAEALDALKELVHRGDYAPLLDACAHEGDAMLPLEVELLVIAGLARTGRGDRALPRAEAALRARPSHPGVRAAAATAHLGLGRLDDAAREADAALALDPGEAQAWLVRAALAVVEHDAHGALEALGEATRSDPSLRGTLDPYVLGWRAAQATRDPVAVVKVLEDRVRFLERRGTPTPGSRELRSQIDLLRQGPVGPLFGVDTTGDAVEIPFTPCWEGSPYRCVGLEAGGREFRVLLDTGNQPGWTVHAPELLEALPNRLGAASSITTGSVDTALVSRRLVTEEVALGGITLRALTGHFFPKPREPWFDANLNPFFIKDRVITLDYVHGRLILRTKQRFDQDMAAADPALTVTVPVRGPEWGFIPVSVNGAPGWCLIETGAEDFSLTRGFADRSGLPLTPATMRFRDRDYAYHTVEAEARVGGLTLFDGETAVWPGRIREPSLGLFYDAILGPGALEGRFALSFDPFDRTAVFERLR